MLLHLWKKPTLKKLIVQSHSKQVFVYSHVAVVAVTTCQMAAGAQMKPNS